MTTKIFPVKFTPAERRALRLRAQELSTTGKKLPEAQLLHRWLKSDWDISHPGMDYPNEKGEILPASFGQSSAE